MIITEVANTDRLRKWHLTDVSYFRHLCHLYIFGSELKQFEIQLFSLTPQVWLWHPLPEMKQGSGAPINADSELRPHAVKVQFKSQAKILSQVKGQGAVS